MLINPLDFEKPIAELDDLIAELRRIDSNAGAHADALVRGIDIEAEIAKVEAQKQELMRNMFSHLSPWNEVQMARHPQRPYTLDYIRLLCDDFMELHGDRTNADDPAIVGGLATLAGRAGRGARPSEGPRPQGAATAQLRQRPACRVPQSAAPDEDGGEVQAPSHRLYRHARRRSQPDGGGGRHQPHHRRLSARDGDAADPDHRQHRRRRRQRRRARHRRRRPYPDAGARGLLRRFRPKAAPPFSGTTATAPRKRRKP